MNLKKDFPIIDIIKFVAAFLVVAIHTHPFEGVNNNLFKQIWAVTSGCAVPYFFIASGFLLFSKVNGKHDKLSQLVQIMSYGKRIVNLYLYWTLFFLPITIWKFANNSHPLYWDFLSFIRGLFLIGENYYSWPLWYLLSMIYSLIIIYILIRANQKTKSIFTVSILIFFMAILMNFTINVETNNKAVLIVSKMIKYSFGSGRLFTGMLYIMIGALFSELKVRIPKRILLLFSLFAIAFQIFKVPFMSPISFAIFPAIIFYFSINFDVNKISSTYFFRKCSTVIYFTHMIIFFLYTLIFKEFRYFGWDAFLISALVPVLLTPIILKYEERMILLKKVF